MDNRPSLAIVVSHPIQYYAPWFAYLTAHGGARIKVFYLWDLGVHPRIDRGFEREVVWDLHLLSGYDHCFVANEAWDPGTHHFRGLNNPGLTEALSAWRPDAILLFGYCYFSHLRIILSRRLRHIPMLFRGDSHLLAERDGPLYRSGKRLLRRLVFRRFSAFLNVGSANADYFREHGVKGERIFFAPHAVDNDRFFARRFRAQEEAGSWRRELGIPEANRVILFAGKFERKKGPVDLLRAFLEAGIPATTLLFVGEGPLESELRHLAGGDDRVRLAPFQNQTAMPRTYAAADLIVLPSCAPDESWGLVINEALCCDKPVVVSDQVGCHPDLVRPGRNGLVFRAGDRRALTAALREAFADPVRLKAWGEEGRKIIEAYSYRETTAGLENALAFILPEKPLR
jgi:glycosyltransferase involved in cell wall biosynthesis